MRPWDARTAPALLVTSIFVLLSPPAWAMDWSVAAGGGASIPVGAGELQEGVSTGISATAAVSFRLGNGFEIAGRFASSHFPRDEDGVLRKSGIEQRPLRPLTMSGGALTLAQGQLDLRFFPSQGKSEGVIHPFLLTSAGLVALDLETAEFLYAYAGHTWAASVAGAEETSFALGFGAGLRFDLSRRFRLQCEARYEFFFLKEENLRSVPLRLELAFGI